MSPPAPGVSSRKPLDTSGGQGTRGGARKSEALGIGGRSVSIPTVPSLYNETAPKTRQSGSTWNPGAALPQWSLPAEVHLPHVTSLGNTSRDAASVALRRRGTGPTRNVSTSSSHSHAGPSLNLSVSSPATALPVSSSSSSPPPRGSPVRAMSAPLGAYVSNPSSLPQIRTPAHAVTRSPESRRSPMAGHVTTASPDRTLTSSISPLYGKGGANSFPVSHTRGPATGVGVVATGAWVQGGHATDHHRKAGSGPASSTSRSYHTTQGVSKGLASSTPKQPDLDRSTDSSIMAFASDEQVRNADDVLAYYAFHGDEAPVPHFYLTPVYYRTGVLKDMVVVPKYKIGSEYAVFSARGVVSVRYGGTPQETSHFETLQEWYRVMMSTRLLLQIHFFQHFRVIKAFAQWKRFIRWHRFCQARISFVKNSFLFQDVLRHSIQDVFKFCATYRSVSLFRSCVRAGTFFTPENFKSMQRSQRIKAVVHYQETMKQIKALVFSGCSAIKKQLAARDIHIENQALRRQQTDIAFRKGASRSIPIEALLAAEDQALDVDSLRAACVSTWDSATFSRFIRLCHFMVNETILQVGFETVEAVREEFAQEAPNRTAVLLIAMVKDTGGHIILEKVESEVKRIVGTLLKEAMYTLATQPSLLQVSKLQKLLCICADGSKRKLTKPLSVLDVVPKSPEYIETQRTLETLLNQDYDAAPSYMGQYEEMDQLQVRLDSGIFRGLAVKPANLNEALFRENLNQGQDHLKMLDRIKTVQQCGILALTCRELKSALYERVYAEIQFVKDTILEYMWSNCVAVLTELHDRVKTLERTPSRLSEYVTYVNMYNTAKYEALPRLTTIMQELLQMRQMCSRYQVVMSAQLLVKLDDLPVASLTFKNTLRQRQQEVVELMRDDFLDILSDKISKLRTVIADAKAHLTQVGAFDTSGQVPSTMIAKLNFFREGIAEKLDKLQTHVEYQRVLNVAESSLAQEEEALLLADRLGRIWKLYALWQRYETSMNQDYFVRFEQDHLFGAYIFFYQRLAALTAEAPSHSVVRHLARLLSTWRDHLPVLLVLTSPQWNLDHWKQAFQAVSTEFIPGNPFTLHDLFDKGLFDGQVVQGIDAFMAEHHAHSAVWSDMLQAAEAKIHQEFHARALLVLPHQPHVDQLQESLQELHFVEVTCVADNDEAMVSLTETGALYDLVVAHIEPTAPEDKGTHHALGLARSIRSLSKNNNICNAGVPIFALPAQPLDDEALLTLSSAAQTANINLLLSPAHLQATQLELDLATHVTGWAQYHRDIKRKQYG